VLKKEANQAQVSLAVPSVQFYANGDAGPKQIRLDDIIKHQQMPPVGCEKLAHERIGRFWDGATMRKSIKSKEGNFRMAIARGQGVKYIRADRHHRF
jgi:hypothetical protein